MARQAARETQAQQGIASEQANTPINGPQQEREGKANSKPEKPLNATQAAIRMAWALSRTGEQLTEALAARGIGLAQVTAEEARRQSPGSVLSPGGASLHPSAARRRDRRRQ